MFKKSKLDSSTTNTVIGEGIKIDCMRITGAGSIRTDGYLIGELDIDGNLTIGETGHVQGDIKVNHVLIAGKMDGNVFCRAGIHLASTAQLHGNIETTTLVVDEGAIFTGTSFMNANSGGNGDRSQLLRIAAEAEQETPDEELQTSLRWEPKG